MPWLSSASLERIRELEQRLNDSVPRAVYDITLARIAELERRVDWQADMLLRRGQTFPVPPVKDEKAPDPPVISPGLSEDAVARIKAMTAEGQRLNLSREEIEEGITRTYGWTERDIAQALKGNGGG